MIYKEARECVDRINTNMNDVRHLVLDLYERDGWTALGYKTWRECAAAEFNQSQPYLYQQLEAAQTEKNIYAVAENIPERQLRPLTKLRDNPAQQREAWQQAVATAPDGKVTAAIVSRVVKEMTEPPGTETEPENTEPEKAKELPEDSLNLGNLKTMWNASNKKDRGRFIRWINEYYPKFIKEGGN